MVIPKPAFAIGQWVRVILNTRNRTPHTARNREVIWHFKDKRYDYYLEERGKKVSNRYLEKDLEAIRMTHSFN
jgi:hypothetical protein